MTVVEGVVWVPVSLDSLQLGVVGPVPRAPVRLRAAGEVGVLAVVHSTGPESNTLNDGLNGV